MVNKFSLFLPLFFLILSPRLCPAEILIEAVNIPGIINQDLSGPYARVLFAISDKISEKMVISISPTKRAIKRFDLDDTKCLFPTSAEMIAQNGGDPASVTFSSPVNVARQFIFTTTSRNQISNFSGLAGKSLGHRAGWQIPARISNDKSVTLVTTNTDNSLYHMVTKGRLDGIIGWIPDFNIMYKKQNLTPLVHNQDFILSEAEEKIACHDTDHGHALIRRINRAIKTMRKSGEIRQSLGAAYVEPMHLP